MQKNIDISDPAIRNRLAELRERLNLTKPELAERAGVSFRTVHDIESGRRKCVQERTLRLLAVALEVTYEALVHGPRDAAADVAPAQTVPPARLVSGRLPLAAVVIVAFASLVVLAFAVNGRLSRSKDTTELGAVAIMCFENVPAPDDPDNLGRIIANLVINNLSESRYVRVISGHSIEESLELGTFVHGSDTECVGASRAARRAGARWILCGSILRDSPALVVTSRLQSTEDGTVLATQKVNAADGETVFDIAARLTAAVKHDLVLPPEEGTEAGLPISHVTTTSIRAYRHYAAGVENLHRLYRDEARRELRLAVSTDPDFAMAHLMLAHPDIAGSEADVDSCVARARRQAEKITRRERCYLEVFEAWSNRDIDKMIDALEKMVDAYPNESEAYRLLGRFYRSTGDEVGALAALEAAVRVDPFDGLSANRLAYHYALLGRDEEAMATAERYVELAPREANPYDTRGDLLAWTGRHDEAIESYKAALKRNPAFFPSMQNLGCVLTLTGEYDEARRYLRMMLRSEDDGARARARWYLAMVDLHQGRLQDALTNLRKGMAADDMEGFDQRFFSHKIAATAKIQAEMGEIDVALATYQAVIDTSRARFPGRYTGRLVWYVQTLAQVDVDRAVAVCDSVLALVDGRDRDVDHIGWACKGWIALARGEASEACESFERAAERNDLFQFRYPLAVAYYEAGRFDEAIATLEYSLGRYSADRLVDAIWSVKAHYLLGLAYEQVGRGSDAARMYAEFLSIWKDADPVFAEIADARARLAALATPN